MDQSWNYWNDSFDTFLYTYILVHVSIYVTAREPCFCISRVRESSKLQDPQEVQYLLPILKISYFSNLPTQRLRGTSSVWQQMPRIRRLKWEATHRTWNNFQYYITTNKSEKLVLSSMYVGYVEIVFCIICLFCGCDVWTVNFKIFSRTVRETLDPWSFTIWNWRYRPFSMNNIANLENVYLCPITNHYFLVMSLGMQPNPALLGLHT